ncbi:MAG: hypothetical protein ACXVAY_15690 [Mucilaginibacter sp.]
MSNIVTVGYTAEGTTDQRFLEAIIKKTIENIADECEGSLEVYDPVFFSFPKQGFIDGVVEIAKKAHNNGIFILCVHTDADDMRDANILNAKINPAFEAVNSINDGVCKNLVPIVPITMSEAWMLANKNLFKSEINTTLSDDNLHINRNPETIANPKQIIEEAIRIAQSHLPRRRDKITISELYLSIGQKIEIEDLERLTSFIKFKTAVRTAFMNLNYLH